MKVELGEQSPVKKTLSIEAPEIEVEKETEAVLRRYAQQVRIPGFRPGKVPLAVVRTRFAKEIEEDVRERLVTRLHAEATRQQGLKPLGSPVLEEVTYEKGQPFRFRTSFEVTPQFSPHRYRGIEVREEAVAVSDADVAHTIESLRQAHVRYVAEEGRSAAAGDVVVADVEGRPEGGEAFRRERAVIEVGSEDALPEFNEATLGVAAGAILEFSVSYPADHTAAHLAGRSVAYKLQVHEVKRRELPAVDDDFAKDLGEFENLDALKTRVREDLLERKRAEAHREARQSLLDKVLLENPIALPEVLVEEELQHRLEDVVRMMILRGLDPRKMDLDWKQLRDRHEEGARKGVHARLVLDAIAEIEGLRVDDAEVEARVRLEAERLGESREAFRAKLLKGGGMEALQAQMVREKTLDFLTSVANIHRAE